MKRTAPGPAHTELAASEARLAAIVDNASDAIISIDGDGLVTLFNPAAERIFGHPAAQMLGAPVHRLLPEHLRAGHPALIDRFARSGATQRAMGVGRVQGLRADGRLLELEASISKAFADGEVMLTAMLRDVTERVAQERLLEMARVELAQGLHDELGQTLAALRLHCEAHRGAASAQRAGLEARIGNLVVLANRQIRGVLSDLRPPLLDELGLAAALDNEIRQHHVEVGEAQIGLRASAEARTQRWPTDVEYAAFMVAREALINALNHASARHIGLQLGGNAGGLVLHVEDDGIGMAAGARVGRPGHLGLIGMRERALAIGASLRIDGAIGRGTIVTLTWVSDGDAGEAPCAASRKPAGAPEEGP